MNAQARPEQSQAGAAGRSEPRIVIIGAGMSGLLMGIRLKQAGYSNFCIYEKASRIGGTWRENTYPNIACDVFAPAYTYSFEPNTDWNYRFGRGEEIQRYFERVESKYRMQPFIRFDSAVESARWNGSQWQIRCADGSEELADVLIPAVGALHHPRYPAIPGLGDFAGPCFHTARWDHTVDIRNKRVGIIGTGSTAAQVVPGIIDKVKQLHLFQRTAQWVFPVADKKFSEGFRQRRRRHPWLARLHHWIDLQAFGIFSKAVLGNRFYLWFIERSCRANLAAIRDPELRRKLTPDYPPACKRLVISEDFYPAIQKENAHLVTEGIERIEERGVRTRDGKLIELDVLVLSTGFIPYKIDVDVQGENGARLSEVWGGSPLMYRTVGVPGFPNFFVLFGPYSPIGNMSIIENSEIQADYVLQCIELIRSGALKAMNPKESVALALKQEMRGQLKHTVWAGGCDSWYLDANGDAITWPFAYSRYREELRAPLLEEYEITR
jgi:cation diffusion facilitator CzcD-associated flavoprotein CzcO